MIQITPQMKILIAIQPVDFRFGIDRLARLCTDLFSSDPFAGAIYVFRNHRATALKILVYDTQGFWLCQKRLSSGTFKYWPSNQNKTFMRFKAYELQILLFAGNPSYAKDITTFKCI